MNRGARVGDLFSGSSVVSQALAHQGYQVTAVDTQQYASVLGISCLGVGRRANEKLDAEDIVKASYESTNLQNYDKWIKLSSKEQAFLEAQDIKALRSMYSNLPLLWCSGEDHRIQLLHSGYPNNGLNPVSIFTEIYAGSYFGVTQAMELDLLRIVIEQKAFSRWQLNAALAALMSAASRCVHSAGKHFAQPIKNSTAGSNRFADGRLLQDRNISVTQSFLEAAAQINSLTHSEEDGNQFILGESERLNRSVYESFDLVYLDPPYTAQQYSRFYHVLETLVSYDVPKLFVDGKLTTGLYPDGRYKSAFSSRKGAELAIKKIIRSAHSSRTNLLASYSHSTAASNGNARMISFEQLIQACKSSYGEHAVSWETMHHSYRQFNSSAVANQRRDDPEVLIKCRIG